MSAIFRLPETVVRLNDNTFAKFDGSDFITLQNIYCQQAIRIKYDILLILYDLVQWKAIGELIAPWPEADQQKILDHLVMMAEAQVLIAQQEHQEVPAATAEEAEMALSAKLAERLNFNVENHHIMLRDAIRLHAYRRAIESRIALQQGNAVALDLGSGSGILSFFAAKAGAKHTIGIERRPDMVLLASEMAKANALEALSFIENASTQVKPSQLPAEPTVLIAEIIGDGILEENVLEFTIDARNRLLKPVEGLERWQQMVPHRVDILLAAYENPQARPDWACEVAELNDLYGFNFELMGKVLAQKITTRIERYQTRLTKTLSQPAVVKTLDLATLEAPFFQEPVRLEVLQSGELSGVVAFFKLWLDDTTTLTNSPWAPQTHWNQLVFLLGTPRPVQAGQVLTGTLSYDGSMRLWLDEEALESDESDSSV